MERSRKKVEEYVKRQISMQENGINVSADRMCLKGRRKCLK